MVLHICPHPGCPHIRDECPNPEHTPGGWTPDQYRGGTTERGYGTEWQRTRKRILATEPRCRQCGAHATDVDHITPRSEGGTNHPANLQALCHPCHQAKTKTDAARGRARRGQR